MTNNTNEIQDKFRFVDAQVAKEPHIFEILNEIELFQEHVISYKKGNLATIDELFNSRNIKIPFSNLRQKNILYLLDILLKSYPDLIRYIISFDFQIDPATKKLTVLDKKEFTVNLKDEMLQEIKHDRDTNSLKSLMDLLSKFRLFNLTKLIKKTKYKDSLYDLINLETGKNIFIFKNYDIDINNTINTENYCFHVKNYDSVRKKLNPEYLRNVIKNHQEPINRRLKKFGIMNSDFSDYRESKIDYIMNIILEEIQSSLIKKELMEVKNFDSLRKCLIEMEKVIDPVIQLNSDILQCIENTGICKESDLFSIFDTISQESMDKWLDENLDSNKIFAYNDGVSESIYVDGKIFLKKIYELNRIINQDREKFLKLNPHEKHDYTALLDLLCRIGKDILKSETKTKKILDTEDNIQILKQIVDNFENSKRKPSPEKEPEKERPPVMEKKSIIRIIIDFIKSLFTGKGTEDDYSKTEVHDPSKASKKFSRETRDFYNEIKQVHLPIIPLSDYIEIMPKNELLIDKIISEIRGNNLKIIIPIYNARKNLYPKRSLKLLISDVEYLMVDPNLIADPDSIRELTDALSGYKIKDEVIPSNTIMTIEKYLLNLNRQRRSKTIRKQG